MNRLCYVLLFFSCGAVAAHRDPCGQISVFFTSTAPPSDERVRKIQLKNTYSLVKVESGCVNYWYGVKSKDPLSTECDFFTNQDNLLNDMRDHPVLKTLEIKLSYQFDLWTEKYVFRLYVKGLLISVFDGRTVKHVRYPPQRLDPEVIEVTKQFAQGRHVEMLTQRARELNKTWSALCETVKNRSSSDDEYNLWYVPNTDRVYCSVKTGLAWQRQIFIGRSRVKSDWTYSEGRYYILGSVPRGDGESFVCVITAANGLSVTRSIFVPRKHLRPRTTRGPPTTRVSSEPDDLLEIDPTTEMTRITAGYDEFEETASRTSVSPATVTAIVVVAIVLGSAIGLFAFRGRVRAAVTGFRRVDARSR